MASGDGLTSTTTIKIVGKEGLLAYAGTKVSLGCVPSAIRPGHRHRRPSRVSGSRRSNSVKGLGYVGKQILEYYTITEFQLSIERTDLPLPCPGSIRK